MRKKGKRLSKEAWNEIELSLLLPDKNISKIARKYGINRHTIYTYAWRHGWMERKVQTTKTFFDVVKSFFKRKSKEDVRRYAYENLRKDMIRKLKRCQICGSKTNLEVHHLKYKNNRKSVMLLCERCHKYPYRYAHRSSLTKENKRSEG